MTKRLRHELTYDAPLAEVAAMLRDPAFREEVCAAQHVLRQTVTVSASDPSGGSAEVTVDQVLPAEGIPSFAKKLVGAEINVVQQESWTSPEQATIEVTIPGKPGHMRGTASLSETGGVTTEVVDLEIKVNIPLVGGRIEDLISGLLLRALTYENRTGVAYLAR